MNIIGFLPLIILDIVKYNEYKDKFKELDEQYKNYVYKIQNGHIEVEEMKKYMTIKKKRYLCLAPIVRTEVYLRSMDKEDREYIIDKYVVNQDTDISKRTYDIFMVLNLWGIAYDQKRENRVSK